MPQQVRQAGVLDALREAHAGLFQHAPRGAVAHGGEAHDLAEPQTARVLQGQDGHIGRVAPAPRV